MDEEDVINTYNGILFNHKKEQNNAICSNMDAARDSHTKWSQKEKDRLWDGKPIKLDCDDNCTTINVINSLSNKKLKSKYLQLFNSVPWILKILLG